MKKMAAMLIALGMLAGCAGMTQREQNTYIGAAIGSILFVPGALIGGYIGHNYGQ
ncbi:MAG: osmotically-inducible lipoprotein B [Alphaproteobacteria bacterium]|nr:osmotically-inducible lipoprotein B [Alphaproteobacteria bacterium]